MSLKYEPASEPQGLGSLPLQLLDVRMLKSLNLAFNALEAVPRQVPSLPA